MAPAQRDGDSFDRRYEGSTGAVNGVRLEVDAWLIDRSADDDTRERAALIVSELASNAVQASPGRAFGLTVRRSGVDRIAIVVSNRAESAHVPARQDWGPDDVLSPGGRGLAIVDALCEDVDIETTDEGDVIVRASLSATFG